MYVHISCVGWTCWLDVCISMCQVDFVAVCVCTCVCTCVCVPCVWSTLSLGVCDRWVCVSHVSVTCVAGRLCRWVCVCTMCQLHRLRLVDFVAVCVCVCVSVCVCECVCVSHVSVTAGRLCRWVCVSHVCFGWSTLSLGVCVCVCPMCQLHMCQLHRLRLVDFVAGCVCVSHVSVTPGVSYTGFGWSTLLLGVCACVCVCVCFHVCVFPCVSYTGFGWSTLSLGVCVFPCGWSMGVCVRSHVSVTLVSAGRLVCVCVCVRVRVCVSVTLGDRLHCVIDFVTGCVCARACACTFPCVSYTGFSWSTLSLGMVALVCFNYMDHALCRWVRIRVAL